VLDAARQDQSLHGFVVLVVDDDSAAIEVVSDFGCRRLRLSCPWCRFRL